MKSTTKLIIKSGLVVLLQLAIGGLIIAQENEETPLTISGSVDTYYKYDFSGNANRPTSFAEDQNSVSIGMVDILLEKSTGKTSFVGEVAFGPRATGAGGSGLGTAPGTVQNLYVSHALTDELSLTAGFMGTFVGYEVISPASNFNYTASYLFSNGPFQNAGIKADYAVSDNVGIMVGMFSSFWDSYIADPDKGMDNFGAQLSFAPIDGWDIYANYLSGSLFSQWDLTTGYQISDPFYVGLNLSQNDEYDGDEEGGFFGIAAYLQYAMSEATTLGLRFESFAPEATDAASITSLTFTGNITAGNLTFIPEFRLDTSDKTIDGTGPFFDAAWLDSDGMATDSFSEIVLAAVYTF